MHILVIGCGYLGLRAARAWRDDGHRVTALTRNPASHPEWPSLGIEVVPGDVLDVESLRRLPAADLCLYAVGYDRTSTADKRTVYVEGVQNVLEEIRSRVPKLIFISSTSVYGQSEGEWVDEASPCLPTSQAGLICRDAEQQVRASYPEIGNEPKAIILRLSGIYGPGRLIARQEQLFEGRPMTGHPDAWLNLIHVDDAVQAVRQLAADPAVSSLYLLSDETPLTRSEFYGAIASRIGAPSPEFDGQGEPTLNKRCDSSRIRRELGLRLRYPRAVDALADLLAEDGHDRFKLKPAADR